MEDTHDWAEERAVTFVTKVNDHGRHCSCVHCVQARDAVADALRDAKEECKSIRVAALREAEERMREQCAKIADAEAVEAYRNPRAANYRNPEMEKMARYTAERIAEVIRREPTITDDFSHPLGAEGSRRFAIAARDAQAARIWEMYGKVVEWQQKASDEAKVREAAEARIAELEQGLDKSVHAELLAHDARATAEAEAVTLRVERQAIEARLRRPDPDFRHAVTMAKHSRAYDGGYSIVGGPAAEAAMYAIADVLVPDERPCTCHPDDNPPRPCPQRFAFSECLEAHRQREAVHYERQSIEARLREPDEAILGVVREWFLMTTYRAEGDDLRLCRVLANALFPAPSKEGE